MSREFQVRPLSKLLTAPNYVNKNLARPEVKQELTASNRYAPLILEIVCRYFDSSTVDLCFGGKAGNNVEQARASISFTGFGELTGTVLLL